jgi:Cu/Ag efflux protein CusF
MAHLSHHRRNRRFLDEGTLAIVMILASSLLTPSTAFTSAEDFLRSYDQTFSANDIVSGIARVKVVDDAAGLITLTHEPVASKDGSLAMPQMSMSLPVSEPAWLHQLQPGAQVRFKAARRRGAITLISIEQIEAPQPGNRIGK